MSGSCKAVYCPRAIETLVPDPSEHVVLLGDFNDSPDSSGIRFWTGRQSLDGCLAAYRDAWGALHPHSEKASGHSRVVADLQIPTRPPGSSV